MLTMDEGLAPKKPKLPTAMVAAMPATTTPKPAPYGAKAMPAAPGVLTSSAGDGFGASPGGEPAPTGLTAMPAPVPIQSPVPTQAPAATPAPVPNASPVSLTPTNPENPLTAQTITPGQGADRFALAQQKYDQFVQSTDPSYQAALRNAKRVGAASGGLGSGQLRTSIGDLAGQRANAMDVQRQGVFTDALGGSIDDAWKSIGLSERQQGFQNQQQQQAFENELRRLGFSEDMINSAFNRGLQSYQAGQAGGTGSGTMQSGASNYAGQGQDALDALNNLTRQRASQPGTTAPAPTPASQIYPWMGPGGMNG